jgi:L-ascorbate metabolism protein UlaG (beta-lactamase superfamily)
MSTRRTSKWEKRENKFQTVPKERVMGDEIVVTFINHSTMLIQTHGINILTDPVWSRRVSPFRFLGPVRYRDPGIRFDELPPIDVVLISHNHYDHMDVATLKQINKKWKPMIFAGLGNARFLRRSGIRGVFDMDWWDKEVVRNGIAIVCAPGQHFSSRAISDRDKTLWCGFVIETPKGPIYFAGDTGYGSFVEKLHEHYPSFRLAFLPIGAFRPTWFMAPVHISPDQAFQMHHELHVETSIAMHFGTFHLADDHQDEPPERIHTLCDDAKGKGETPNFIVLENGEQMTIA